MEYRILRRANDEWINLYPEHDGENPPTFKTRGEAEEYARRLNEHFHGKFKIVPAEEALEHEIPERW